MPLTAAIEVSTAQPDAAVLRVKWRITNPAGAGVAILNPGRGRRA
ncbi:MAG: hypothetical protein QOD11_1851 [Bradyrhizobium sp.]|nr:hypothetical protein [Bradyrhizobium sp.]